MTILKLLKLILSPWRHLRNQPKINRLEAELRAMQSEADDSGQDLRRAGEAIDILTSQLTAEQQRVEQTEEHLATVEHLLACAIDSIEVLNATLLDRMRGNIKDANDVYRLLSSNTEDRSRKFVPLQQRRRAAKRQTQAEEIKRGAVLAKPELPIIPLSPEAMAYARQAVAHLSPVEELDARA